MDLEKVELGLQQQLSKIARERSLSIEKKYTKDSVYFFQEIINQITYRESKQVVVLVDEYDAPFTSLLTSEKNVDELSEVFGDFYKTIKSSCSQGQIRYVFFTGITHLASTSIFSALNNMKDESHNQEFAELIGFTEGEIRKYYS